MNNKKSDNMIKAEEIKKNMPEDVRIATEAMQRTITARRINIYYPKKYQYHKIY